MAKQYISVRNGQRQAVKMSGKDREEAMFTNTTNPNLIPIQSNPKSITSQSNLKPIPSQFNPNPIPIQS